MAARRKELGIDHKTIATRLDISRNYWSAVENERTLLSREKLDEVIEFFEFDEDAATELNNLREQARGRGWWHAYADRYDENDLRLISLEHGATRLRAYESMAIPGLLQTEDYARALIELDPFFSKVGVDDAVAVRLRRQKRLVGSEPLEVSAIVSEAALIQQWAAPDIQNAQLAHILDLSRRQNIQFRVLPLNAPPGILGLSSTLAFYSFESRYLPSVAFQEAVRLFDPVQDGTTEFRRLELCWNEGRRRALSPGDTQDRLESLLRGAP